MPEYKKRFDFESDAFQIVLRDDDGNDHLIAREFSDGSSRAIDSVVAELNKLLRMSGL